MAEGAGTIDSLSIEIGASSTKAVQQINKLADALKNLKTATAQIDNGAAGKLRALADAMKSIAGVGTINISAKLPENIAKLAGAMKAVKSEDISKLRQVASAIKTLDGVKGIAINNKLAQNIADIAAAADLLKADHTSKITAFGNALKAIGAGAKLNDKLAGQITAIAQAVEQISDETLNKINRLTKALARLRNLNLPNIRNIGGNGGPGGQGGPGGSGTGGRPGTGGQNPAGGQSGSGPPPSNAGGLLGNMKRIAQLISGRIQSGMKGFSDLLKRASNYAARIAKSITSFAGKKIKGIWDKTAFAGLEKSLGRIKNIINSFGRVAFYRAIRSAIKYVTDALKEGVENAYHYAREFGDATSYIADAYDRISSLGFKMSNQLGAAWATMIAYIEPIIVRIINLVTKAADAITQLFALMSGKRTYLKAVDYNKQWAESATGATKAAKEWKNQLMGFDEINRLDAPSDGSSGNGSNLPDYGSMFEEVPVTRNFLSDLIDQIKNGEWSKIGEALAEKVNGLVDSIDWYSWGNKIGEKINAAIQTIYSFLKNVDFKKLGSSIAQGLMGMMDAIDFETVGRLFVRKFTAMLDFIIGFVTTPGFWEKLAKAVGDLFHGALSEASEWLKENNLADVIGKVGQGILGVLQRVAEEIKEHKDVFIQIGQQIGNALAAIPWVDILKTIADILWTVFKSLIIDGLLSTEGGKIFAALFLGVKGLKLAFTMAVPVVEAGIAILVKAVAGKLLGIPAAAEATATATTTALGGIGAAMTKAAPVIAKAGLAVFDAVMVAYDVKSLNDAAKTYKGAMDAHAHEAYSALNNYAKLYHEKGKEVADAWAKMVYDVDTTGEDFYGAQKALTNKIDDLWADTPQNMAQGFGQGLKYYFGGGGGGGLVGLLNDAGNGIINTFKNILGIHSPSTVFAELGKNLVYGLKNGFSSAWNSFASMINQLVSGVVSTITGTISGAVQNAWSNITSMVSSAKSTLSSIASSVSSTVSNAVSTAKNFASSFSIRKYASGGFPEDGLFYANHNELIGQFSNGQTAVANNDQIVEGISEGVYQAVAAALSSGNMGSDTPVNIYLDGKLIAQSTTKYQKQFARAAG